MILQGLQNWNCSVISVTSGRKSIRPSIAQQWMIKMHVSQKCHRNSRRCDHLRIAATEYRKPQRRLQRATRTNSHFSRRNSTERNKVQVPRGISPRALDAIYAIKMWLFRNQFPIQQRQSSERASRQSYSQKVWNHLLRVSLFVTTTYVKYWFTCTSPAEAQRNDLH